MVVHWQRSLLMTVLASHVSCTIVAATEGASVTNRWTVCVIRSTVKQHFNWYRAWRRSLDDSGATCFLLFSTHNWSVCKLITVCFLCFSAPRVIRGFTVICRATVLKASQLTWRKPKLMHWFDLISALCWKLYIEKLQFVIQEECFAWKIFAFKY